MDETQCMTKRRHTNDCASLRTLNLSSSKLATKKANQLNITSKANKSRTFLLLLLNSECSYLKKTQISMINSKTFAEAEKDFDFLDVYVHLKPELHSPGSEHSGKGEGSLNKSSEKYSSQSPDRVHAMQVSKLKIDENFGKKETIGRRKLEHFVEKVLRPIQDEDSDMKHHRISKNILAKKTMKSRTELGFNYLRRLCRQIKNENVAEDYSKAIEKFILIDSVSDKKTSSADIVKEKNSHPRKPERTNPLPSIFVSSPDEMEIDEKTKNMNHFLKEKKMSLQLSKKKDFCKRGTVRAVSVINLFQCKTKKKILEELPAKQEDSSESDDN